MRHIFAHDLFWQFSFSGRSCWARIRRGKFIYWAAASQSPFRQQAKKELEAKLDQVQTEHRVPHFYALFNLTLTLFQLEKSKMDHEQSTLREEMAQVKWTLEVKKSLLEVSLSFRLVYGLLSPQRQYQMKEQERLDI